jgi:hypothetical protein
LKAPAPFPALLLGRVSSPPPDEQQVPRTQERFVAHFSVGEQVIIRYGRHQGQKATILRSLAGDAYSVKVEDGTVLFYSNKGLEKLHFLKSPDTCRAVSAKLG